MHRRTLFFLVVLSSLLLIAFACAKKPTVEAEPPVEEVTPDIPPVEEEKPVEEPPVVEEKMPILGDVFFDFDKYNLKEEYKRQLEQNAKELKGSPSVNIVIEGHCDERGTVDYNMALGEKRARAALDYLIALGINPNRIGFISYGKSRPFDPGHDEEAWAKNRRAHFVIKKK
ncbi:MAG: peptidoglycan-associated lipoprotein Pal [Candidatus Latescibacteria bacterium]|nr:peptidoglycan-associated lipoprotein Pal [Candidatus Latescibacterota bacterium]NIO27241.1 peptidoglycan-associated lipoprotein Pal [Candidatus Latescibacterota bacterium]NIO54765.1 peptidoglycan-associated lipoprotein Pal [Candidatus Latescibacterota bacterium]NIT00848.1 peptidoglycan-associated lipoprotein Pal [Candidatus Latescibacterota bacterium]NIT37771.1 peptidoglycan-associated lipoprotein Pal [Candidatus Latescibacterota bacterium]